MSSSSTQTEEENPNWSQWEQCVRELLPGDRWLLQHGGIDPNEPVRVSNHLEHIRYAPPLSFLQRWWELLWRLRPPPGHPFHRFWKLRRQQEVGLLVPPAGATSSQDEEEEEDPEDMQPQQKKPRLAQQAQAAPSSGVVQQPSNRDMVDELLRLLQDPRFRTLEALDAPLSPEEQRELAPLVPDGHGLSAKELARRVRDSKSELIQELVLEDRVRTLLEFGANPNPVRQPELWDGDFQFPLPLQVWSCSTSMVRLLLEAKADPNLIYNESLESPLVAHLDNPEAVRLLLEAGANPNDYWLHGSPQPSLSDRIESPIFLRFVDEGAPAECLRLLLEYKPEIIGHFEELDEDDEQPDFVITPISVLVQHEKHLPDVHDIVLKVPFPIPAACHACENDAPGCWAKAAYYGRPVRPYRSPAFLQALVRVGYPTRGRLQEVIKRLLGGYPDPEPAGGNLQERLEILQSVTEEGQTERRQEYLGGFWSALMQAVPGMSGVVASLVLQAIVPEFQLRIA